MITIQIINQKWEPGKNLGLSKRDEKRFEDYMAEEYVRIIKERVNSQRYRNKWKPLSQRYLGYKRRKGLSLKTWEATMQTISSLRVKRGNVIGFDNRVRHRETKKRLIDIARANEYGTRTVPARPLFRFVYWYMRKNTKYFYDKYVRSGGK